jgi:predicted 3-demethylubiquinone-9 3-methyltransferase (glyoxalase superfamily)
MPKITSHLWYDTEAEEAADFYVSLFPDSKIASSIVLENTPSGDVDIVNISLAGEEFTLISAGPLFKFNPLVSFTVACKTVEEADELWKKLCPGEASVLMKLGEYPFSKRYGWTADKFGLSWQIVFTGDYPYTRKITPTLMFAGEVSGKAEEAMNFYASVFPESSVGGIARYPAGMEPDAEGTVMHAAFNLSGLEFFAMDSAREHRFRFNEAVSFMVHCTDQKEIDYYWDKLSAVPEAEQCGWLKDKFGLSWQIVPAGMDEMLSGGDREKIARVTEAFLKMKKLDLAELEKAAKGK